MFCSLLFDQWPHVKRVAPSAELTQTAQSHSGEALKDPIHFQSQSPLTGCYYHYSFQWTYAGPSFKVSDGCYTNRPQNSNPTLAFFPPLSITYKDDCCDKVDWAGSHLDFNFIELNSNGVISVLRLYSHWVSGWPLVCNTSRPPHFGWLVCREKRGRGNHYSSLLLLAWDEALNPACMQAFRGQWENNTEETAWVMRKTPPIACSIAPFSK